MITFDKFRIKQIIPADGWFAGFKDPGGNIDYCPVLCFALVSYEDKGDAFTEVKPICWGDPYADFCDESSNFDGLRHLSELPEKK
jgi:hypothetical protein